MKVKTFWCGLYIPLDFFHRIRQCLSSMLPMQARRVHYEILVWKFQVLVVLSLPIALMLKINTERKPPLKCAGITKEKKILYVWGHLNALELTFIISCFASSLVNSLLHAGFVWCVCIYIDTMLLEFGSLLHVGFARRVSIDINMVHLEVLSDR